MNKIVLSIAFALTFTLNLMGQDVDVKKANPNAPTISLDKDEYDYGTIYQNSEGETYFVYKNEGKEPLIFSRVKSSCGCTIPKWSRMPLMPGQSDTLKVRYDTKRLGSFHKSITIMSNATVPRKVIKIKGKVIPEPTANMPTKNIDEKFSPINK